MMINTKLVALWAITLSAQFWVASANLDFICCDTAALCDEINLFLNPLPVGCRNYIVDIGETTLPQVCSVFDTVNPSSQLCRTSMSFAAHLRKRVMIADLSSTPAISSSMKDFSQISLMTLVVC
jgi:hypothetical protein